MPTLSSTSGAARLRLRRRGGGGALGLGGEIKVDRTCRSWSLHGLTENGRVGQLDVESRASASTSPISTSSSSTFWSSLGQQGVWIDHRVLGLVPPALGFLAFSREGRLRVTTRYSRLLHRGQVPKSTIGRSAIATAADEVVSARCLASSGALPASCSCIAAEGAVGSRLAVSRPRSKSEHFRLAWRQRPAPRRWWVARLRG